MKYKVKLSYGPNYVFDNIEEAGVFFEQALIHTDDELRWASIETIYPEQDTSEEETDD